MQSLKKAFVIINLKEKLSTNFSTIIPGDENV